MFEITLIALSRLLLVLIGFKLYRLFVANEVLEQPVIGRDGMIRPGVPRTQQGYIFLKGSGGRKSEKARFRKLKGDLRVPWGW